MADGTKRIIDQPLDTALSPGDLIIVDSEESGVGTRKFDLGTELTEIKTELQELINRGGGTGLTDAEKSLILTLFNQAAYSENDAGTAYNQLSNLWSGYSITWSGSGFTHSNNSSSITGGSTFTSTVSASSGFTITGVVATMGGNTVQGAWQNGTVTIPNVTGNIVITVTTSQATVASISALYTQSGTVYDTDSLDSLKSDLVVTATYVDQSTYTVPSAEYTLSGTLTEGTSTITVSYGGKTTTFNVTVTERVVETVTITWTGSGTDKTAGPVIDATSRDGYLTIPFVQGDANLSSTAVDGGDIAACVPYLYSDSSATTLVGYYDIATGEVYTSSSWSWNSRPNIVFGQNTLVAPRGYYVKIIVSNNRSAFTSNGTCGTYLNAHATTVTLP